METKAKTCAVETIDFMMRPKVLLYVVYTLEYLHDI